MSRRTDALRNAGCYAPDGDTTAKAVDGTEYDEIQRRLAALEKERQNVVTMFRKLEEIDWDVLQSQLAEIAAEKERLQARRATLETLRSDTELRRQRVTALLAKLDDIGELTRRATLDQRRRIIEALDVEVQAFADRSVEISGAIAPFPQEGSRSTNSVLPRSRTARSTCAASPLSP
jgi:uncharacterized protein YPO0396